MANRRDGIARRTISDRPWTKKLVYNVLMQIERPRSNKSPGIPPDCTPVAWCVLCSLLPRVAERWPSGTGDYKGVAGGWVGVRRPGGQMNPPTPPGGGNGRGGLGLMGFPRILEFVAAVLYLIENYVHSSRPCIFLLNNMCCVFFTTVTYVFKCYENLSRQCQDFPGSAWHF